MFNILFQLRNELKRVLNGENLIFNESQLIIIMLRYVHVNFYCFPHLPLHFIHSLIINYTYEIFMVACYGQYQLQNKSFTLIISLGAVTAFSLISLKPYSAQSIHQTRSIDINTCRNSGFLKIDLLYIYCLVYWLGF